MAFRSRFLHPSPTPDTQESHYNSVRAVTDPCRPGEPAQQWAGVASVAPPPAPAPAATGNGKTKKGKGGNGKLPTKKGHEQQDAGGADGGDEGGEGVDMKDAAVGEEEEEDGAATPEQEAEAQPHGRVEERDAAADAGEATAKAVGGQCPCGSGRRYRKCCRKADRQRRRGVGAAARKYGGSPSEEDTEETPGPRHAAASRKKKKQPPATGATTAPAAAGTVANKDDASVNAVAAKLEAIAM